MDLNFFLIFFEGIYEKTVKRTKKSYFYDEEVSENYREDVSPGN